MKIEINPRVVSNFFLDGSKILFGSLVVGVFAPSAAMLKGFPWMTIIAGVSLTIIFLVIANIASERQAASVITKR